MARGKAATAKKPPETPASSPDVDLDEFGNPIAFVDAPQPSAAEAPATSDEGLAEAEVQDATPPELEAGIAPAPEGPEAGEPELPEIAEARRRQAGADLRAQQLEQQLNEERAQRIIQQREAKRRDRQALADRDPDAFIRETLEEDERRERDAQVFMQHEGVVLNYARTNAQHLFPDLSNDDLREAEMEMHQLAAPQGRPATAAEILGMYGEYRVRKVSSLVEQKDARIKELEEKVAAYQNGESGYILEGDEGPETPAAPGSPAKLNAQTIAEMSDDEYDARRDEIMAFQARILRGS